MEFRSFYGSTIREALNAARKELGPDAAILASRQAETEPGEPILFEAVCGVVPAAERVSPAKPAAPLPQGKAVQRAAPGTPVARRIPASETAPRAVPVQPQQPRENRAFANLRNHVDHIRQVITPEKKSGTALDGLRGELLLDGFEQQLATEIIGGVRERVRTADLASAISSELQARVMTDSSMGRANSRRKVLALAGPPGVGKTSLLVKIAVKYGLTGKRPLRIISLDSSRVGGTDALRAYAAGMGVPIDVAETGAAMVQAIEAHSENGLVLIDTPGLSPSDVPASQEMIAALVRHPEIDLHLVVSAMMSPANLKTTMARFRPLMPSKIAITQTDAAAPGRSLVALALNHELPLSFAGTGPGIPRDIAECSVPLLIGGSATATERGRSAVSAA